MESADQRSAIKSKNVPIATVKFCKKECISAMTSGHINTSKFLILALQLVRTNRMNSPDLSNTLLPYTCPSTLI